MLQRLAIRHAGAYLRTSRPSASHSAPCWKVTHVRWASTTHRSQPSVPSSTVISEIRPSNPLGQAPVDGYANGAPINGLDDQAQNTKEFLQKAYKDGSLHIKPDDIGKLLGQFPIGVQLSASDLRNACAKSSISIDAAYTLARLLVRCPGPVDRFQGRQIMLAASQLGSAQATLHIVKTATTFNQLDFNDVQPALKHLQELTKQDSPLIPALVAQARVHEHHNDYEFAEQLYQKAIDHVPRDAKPLSSRLLQKFRDNYGANNYEAIKTPKINLDDSDPELDIVAAHLGLANLYYNYLNKPKAAYQNWETAAKIYDDPVAYFYLGKSLEDEARNSHEDKFSVSAPLDHDWMIHVPYKWYEYTMKAAISGHAEACFKIGLFYLLLRDAAVKKIVDSQLRRVLQDSPLIQTTPAAASKLSSVVELTRNRMEIIYRWFMCAAKGGYNPGYILAQYSKILHAPEDDLHISNILSIADGEPPIDKDLAKVKWTEADRALAKAFKDYFRASMQFVFDGDGNYKLNIDNEEECVRRNEREQIAFDQFTR